jgi:hypothetical protein
MKRIGLHILLLLASRAEAQTTISYVCNAKASFVYLTPGLTHLGEVNRRKQRGWHVEAIDVTTLVTTTAVDDPRGFYRVASRKITRRCGVFKIIITAGWVNANPYGYLGAIEFPRVELRDDGGQVLRPTALHSCEPDQDLYAAAGCPNAFADVIEVRRDRKAKRATVDLRRDGQSRVP